MARPDAFTVNDELAGSALGEAEALDFVCECGRPGCEEVVQLTVATFGWARQRGLSVLSRGHQDPRDSVVETTDGFVLVRRRAG